MSVEILKKLSLFEGLEEGDLTRISPVVKERTFPKGTVIFKEGDAGDAFYLILDGAVEVLKKEGSESKVVHTIEHTDKTPFFGEMALIEGVPRSATLRVSKDLKCLVIEKNDFDMMLRLNSFISLRIMTALSRRLRSSSTAAEKPVETKQGQVIALFSPKSGSGKSILAANLAAGLTKITGGKVLLIDLDLQFGDLGFMLPLKPKHTIADLVEKTADKCQDIKDFVVDHALGFSVLPAPKKPEQSELVNSTHLRNMVGAARGIYDYIILDTHSMFHDLTINSLDIADLVLLMMVPNMNHLKNTVVCLQVMENLKYPKEKIKLLLNRCNCERGMTREALEGGLKRPIDFMISDDFQNVSELIEHQKTVYEITADSPYRDDMNKLIETLTGKKADGGKKGLTGLLKSFFGQ